MFHISPQTGNANVCRAKAGNCPFGVDEPHFSTVEEARVYYEAQHQTFDSTPAHEKVVKQCEENTGRLKFAARRTPGASVDFYLGRKNSTEKQRTIEAWLDLPGEEGTVAFVKLYLHDGTAENYYSKPYLSMCDIETKVSHRKQGFALELRKSIEEKLNLPIFSSGGLTPEGFEAFGKHLKRVPVPEAYEKYQPAIEANYSSMGFVASWKHKIPRFQDRSVPRSEEQQMGAWEIDRDIFDKLDNHEMTWVDE